MEHLMQSADRNMGSVCRLPWLMQKAYALHIFSSETLTLQTGTNRSISGFYDSDFFHLFPDIQKPDIILPFMPKHL
ncbi:MAG: hypothetical protein LBQ15_10625 [Clostridium sp.]|jgi:hypothetical protein|nr:hypothetical protein [Clostridium sp.]